MTLIDLFAFILCEYVNAVALNMINIVPMKKQSLNTDNNLFPSAFDTNINPNIIPKNIYPDIDWRPTFDNNWHPGNIRSPYQLQIPNIQSGSSDISQNIVLINTQAQITNIVSWYTIISSKVITLLPSSVEFDKITFYANSKNI